ncbi:helix-turn-helix domain-containing protein [Thalassospira marina]|nr:helix-turn-helix domain-containing protein [Thalassospira marina]
MNTVNFYEGVELFISVLGLLQAGFFCVVLLSEGRLAYRANRWMILFIAAVSANLIEDVVDVLGSTSLNFYGEVVFLPFNFVITPAIYLYFCEVSGGVKINRARHFAIVPIMANLAFWLVIGIGKVPENGDLSYELAMSITASPLMAVLINIVHFGLYVQAVIYVVLLWRVARRYFRQVQMQLGAQRDDMVRWMRNVLGSVLFIFLVFVAQELMGDLRHDGQLWSFQFLNVAFLLVFFWLSYTLATHQVVFVLPDWDDTAGDDDLNDADMPPAPPIGADRGLPQNVRLYDKGVGENSNGGNPRGVAPPIRHFLDKNDSAFPANDGSSAARAGGHDVSGSSASPANGLHGQPTGAAAMPGPGNSPTNAPNTGQGPMAPSVAGALGASGALGTQGAPGVLGRPGAEQVLPLGAGPGANGVGTPVGAGAVTAGVTGTASGSSSDAAMMAAVKGPGAPGVASMAGDAVPRPLLDDDDVERATRRLQVIHSQGELLHDPMISLPKLARAVGISPNQLSYVLNHHVGQNFFDFVNSARVAEARRLLLREPDRPILDVALEVGFNSKSTFNLAFKKITGETPSSLRRKENGTS